MMQTSATTTPSSMTSDNHRMVRRNISSSVDHNARDRNLNNTTTVRHLFSRSTQITSAQSVSSTQTAASFRNGIGSHSTAHVSAPRSLTYQHQQQSQSRWTTATACHRKRILSVVAAILIICYFMTTIKYSRTIFIAQTSMGQQQQLHQHQEPTTTSALLLPGFASILHRAQQHSQICTKLQPDREFDTRSTLPFHNDTVASLPAFGIINAIQSYANNNQNDQGRGTTASSSSSSTSRRTATTSGNDKSVWPICQMPPITTCNETQLSVIFMAYNPDRLGITLSEIRRMFDPNIFFHLIKEVVLVWNGERHIDESEDGRNFLEYVSVHPIRIVYPLKMGFPNDLMNRYHPQVVQPTTQALLYYDDDGPFYSYQAIQAGFELWKRHSQAQIGAMARQIIYSPRQQEYKVSLLGAESAKKTFPVDNVFVSHCTNVEDTVDYEFHFFANYDANMVLPSGSMLHSNYLCFLWHPIFDEIRQFVLLHPVHPDDMTVSLIVSQLAGVAPRVYSKRLDRIQPNKKIRRLTEQVSRDEIDYIENLYSDESMDIGIVPLSEQQRHRSLMFSICWDCGSGMTEMKQYWAELRTEAVNALVRYFGSINSGSIGWCPHDSEYYNVNKDGRCWPVLAKQGMLPWMNSDGTPKDTCP